LAVLIGCQEGHLASEIIASDISQDFLQLLESWWPTRMKLEN